MKRIVPFLIVFVISALIVVLSIVIQQAAVLLPIGIVCSITAGGTAVVFIRNREQSKEALHAETVRAYEEQLNAVEAELNKVTEEKSSIKNGRNDNIERIFLPIAGSLEDKVQLIPVLIEQLKKVIEYTDEAAVTLSTSFMNINKQAKTQVKEMGAVYGTLADDNQSEGTSILYTVRAALDELIANFKMVTTLIKKNQESTQKIIEQTQHIKDIVRKTGSIAENSKVLSINATIEAARAGQYGKGFSVVAGEFKKLSEDSEDANNEIQETVNAVAEETKNVYMETESGVSKSEELTRQAEEKIQHTLADIDSTIEETKNKLEDVSQQAQVLAKNISSIVVSIQFQDITRQRIEHVIEPLDEFAKDLRALSADLKNSDSLTEFKQKDHRSWLESKYTMEDERLVLQNAMNKAKDENKGEEE